MFSSKIPPLLRRPAETATRAESNQVVSSFSRSTTQTRIEESITRMGTTRTAGSFSSVTSSLEVRASNGSIQAFQRGSNDPLASIQPANIHDVPASGLTPLPGSSAEYKVKLIASPALGGLASDIVIFDVMPSIAESHSAQYDQVDVVHHPGAMLKYKGTNGRTWSINADLVSRTVSEADENLRRINLLRSWLMPFYGNGTANDYPDKLGAPPQILTFEGFGPRMIGRASVVLTSYNWSFEPEIDYIYTSGQFDPDGKRVPFPVHLRIACEVAETYSPYEFTQFSLRKYREGDMPSAFGRFAGAAPQQANTVDTSRINISEVQNATPNSLLTQTESANRAFSDPLGSFGQPFGPVGLPPF